MSKLHIIQDCLFPVWDTLFHKQLNTFSKDGEYPYTVMISVIYLSEYKNLSLMQLCLHFG